MLASEQNEKRDDMLYGMHICNLCAEDSPGCRWETWGFVSLLFPRF